MSKFFVIVVAVVMVCIANTASADWSRNGWEDGSWGEYNQIDLYYVAGDVLNIPTFTGLSAGWQNWDAVNTFDMAVAYGPATTGQTDYTLNFLTYAYPLPSGYSVLLYQVALDTTVVGRGEYQFFSDGGIIGTSISDARWYADGGGDPLLLPTAVPEPVSTTLFLLGGATLAARRLRRK